MSIQTTFVTATIANGASLSDAINLKLERLRGIVMPAGWDAAGLTFQVSHDGGVTFNNLHDSAGTEINFTVAAARFVILPTSLHWSAAQWIKVRSGTSGAAVNQTAERLLRLVTSPDEN